MKKKIVYILLILLAILIQVSVLPVIMPGGMVVDNVLMLVLAGATIDGFGAFLGWSITAGILYDLASYSKVGVHVIIFLCVVYFVSFFSRRFSVEMRGVGLVIMLLFVAVATLVSHFVFATSLAWDMGTLQGFSKNFGSLANLSLQVLGNSLVFFAWFAVLKKIKKYYAI